MGYQWSILSGDGRTGAVIIEWPPAGVRAAITGVMHTNARS